MSSVAGMAGVAIVAGLLSGCAVIEESISPPDVRLRTVELEKVDFSSQRFLLSFDVSNPNPFPLPIKSIDYGVRLDGYRFASGATDCDILIAAGGDGEFAISVDLDLLNTAPVLLAAVRKSDSRDIPYAIKGSVALDIPATRPLSFEQSGAIRLTAALD
jgi:LEA14-like dessication related protein